MFITLAEKGTAYDTQNVDLNKNEQFKPEYLKINPKASCEHMKTSPSFAARPMGVYVDPDKMIAARKAGASRWDLHERAFAGEFAPPKPYDPRALL